jgi:hypothetical protein
MPLSPFLVLEARSGTKFQLLPLFNLVGPTLGLTRNLGARQHLIPNKCDFESLTRIYGGLIMKEINNKFFFLVLMVLFHLQMSKVVV